MKNKDREKLSAAFKVIAVCIAVLMLAGYVLQAFMM